MWSAKVSSLSRVTPKSRTLDEKVKSGKVEAMSLWLMDHIRDTENILL